MLAPALCSVVRTVNYICHRYTREWGCFKGGGDAAATCGNRNILNFNSNPANVENMVSA